MKMFKFSLYAIGGGIAAISVLGLSKIACYAESTQPDKTGIETNVKPGSIPPYVPPADVLVPESSKSVPGDNGLRGHTNILIRKPTGIPQKPESARVTPNRPNQNPKVPLEK